MNTNLIVTVNNELLTKELCRVKEENIIYKPCFSFDSDKCERVLFSFTENCINIKRRAEKRTESYKNILKCLEYDDCIIIVLKNEKYFYLPIGNTDDYNISLIDISLTLKEKCKYKYNKIYSLEFPEISTDYPKKRKGNPIAEIEFKPTLWENILHNIWDYYTVFDISILTLISAIILFILYGFNIMALLIFGGIGIAIAILGVIIIIPGILNEKKISENGIILTLYNKRMVCDYVKYPDRYIDIKYSEFNKTINFFNIKIYGDKESMGSGWSYTLMIPKRILAENPDFKKILSNKFKR